MIRGLEECTAIICRGTDVQYQVLYVNHLDAVEVILSLGGLYIRTTFPAIEVRNQSAHRQVVDFIMGAKRKLEADTAYVSNAFPGRTTGSFISSLRCNYCRSVDSFSKGFCKNCGAAECS